MKLSPRLITNVVVFFLAATAITVYGFVQFFGNPFDDPPQITTELATSSGLRENFSVSHNGIVVGVISGTDLTEEGVRITVTLDDGVEIPEAVEARVIRASPVGEQRLELEPTGDGSGPLLEDGDEVPAAADAEPPVVSEVVDEVVDLLEAVPADALNTVIEETSLALDGRAEDIALFIESSTALNEALLANEADFRRLLDAAPEALATLNGVGDELEASLRNSTELTRVLAERRDDLVSLFRNGADLGAVGRRVTEDNGPNLVCLTSDLADLNELIAEPENLRNLDQGFRFAFGFFGPITNVAPQGPAKDIGLGDPNPDQTWLRVRLLTPPQQPSATPNVPPRDIRDVRVGAACRTPLGPGADAPTQADPAPLFPGTEVRRASGDEAEVTGLGGPAVLGQLGGGSSAGGGILGLAPLAVLGLLVLTVTRHRVARKLVQLWFG